MVGGRTAGVIGGEGGLSNGEEDDGVEDVGDEG